MKTLINIISCLNAYKARVVLMMILSASFALPASAQEVLWHKLIGKANTLQQQRRYQDAEGIFNEALKVAEDTFGPGHQNVAISLNKLADLYISKGDYAMIEPLYVRALTILEKTLGPDNPDVALASRNLAELYYNQGRYKEAVPLYTTAHKILKETLGPDHPEVTTMSKDLASLYRKIGRQDEEEQLLE